MPFREVAAERDTIAIQRREEIRMREKRKAGRQDGYQQFPGTGSRSCRGLIRHLIKFLKIC